MLLVLCKFKAMQLNTMSLLCLRPRPAAHIFQLSVVSIHFLGPGSSVHYTNDMTDCSVHYINDMTGSSVHYTNDMTGSSVHYTNDIAYCRVHYTNDMTGSRVHYTNDMTGSSADYTNDMTGSSVHYTNDMAGSSVHYAIDMTGCQAVQTRSSRSGCCLSHVIMSNSTHQLLPEASVPGPHAMIV